jgi:hypothetical protein
MKLRVHDGKWKMAKGKWEEADLKGVASLLGLSIFHLPFTLCHRVPAPPYGWKSPKFFPLDTVPVDVVTE